MRWNDREFASGSNITGAPTVAGEAALRPFAATRPALNAILEYLPSARTGAGQTVSANVGGQNITVPVGTLAGAKPFRINAANFRTAIGLAVNLPQFQILNNHHRQDQNQDFTPNVQSINSFLPGVPRWQGYRYCDYFFLWQDEWRVRPDLTLTYGIRYELPGNAVDFLRTTIEEVFALNNSDPAWTSLPTATAPLGNAGRNIPRSDGIGNVDLAVMKTFKMPYSEGHTMNFRGDFFNLTNSRNLGIPEARISNAGFLNQWNTDGGKRRIVFTLRYAF